MDFETSNKVKQIQKELALDVKRICENHGLRYFLDSGTLLGAVRHKGFIPWDDDLDMGMLREDYENFIKYARNELESENELVDWKHDDAYPHQFCKIMRKGTIYREEAQGGKGKCGVYIDIFPYDEFPDNKNQRLIQKYEITILRGMIRAKCKHRTWRADGKFYFNRWFKNLPMRFISAFFSKKFLVYQYEKIAQKYNGNHTLNYFPQGVESYGEWVIPKECLNQTDELLFEGEKFSVPVKWDTYLKICYGDYMTPPPENERYKGHSIVEIRL